MGDMESLRGLSLRRGALPGTDQLLHLGMHGQIFYVKCLGFRMLVTHSNICKTLQEILSLGRRKMQLMISVTSTLAQNNNKVL